MMVINNLKFKGSMEYASGTKNGCRQNFSKRKGEPMGYGVHTRARQRVAKWALDTQSTCVNRNPQILKDVWKKETIRTAQKYLLKISPLIAMLVTFKWKILMENVTNRT